MISLTTSDGVVHAGHDWRDLLESAYPERTAATTLGMLVGICTKEHDIDVTFGQSVDEIDGFTILARLHECSIVVVDFTELP